MEKENLYKFIEGTSSSEEDRQIRQWLEDSKKNRETMSDEYRFFDTTTLHTTPVREVRSGRLQPAAREFLKIAATILLVIAGGYAYQKYSDKKSAETVQTISVPTGQRVSLTLPDGSHVWLNARSTLSYPVVFGKKNREMKLEGEAYFEVKSDAAHPFIVHSPKGEVTALGTHFNVNDYPYSPIFEATLMKGKVNVKANADPSEEILLTPDNKAVLTDGKLLVKPVDDYTRYKWIDGMIAFKNESFLSIMKEFEKCYEVNIQVKSLSLDKYKFTGKFRYTDGVDYALRVLQHDIHFKYSRDDEKQVIYIE